MIPHVRAATLRGRPGSRPDRDAAAILDRGFQGVVLAEPFHEIQWEVLHGALPSRSLLAVEIFLPWPRDVRPGMQGPFEIAGVHPESRRDAARQGVATVLFAEKSSIPLILVPPCRLESPPREASLAPGRDPRREERLARLRAARRASGKPHLDSLLGLLSRLLSAADRYGVEVALAPGGYLDEFPSAEEATECFREFRGAPLRPWIDTASEAAALALSPPGSPPPVLEGAAAGATLRDMDAGGAPARPGEGLVDWERARARIGECPVWVVDPREATPAALEVARSFVETLEEGPRRSEGILGP